MLQALIELIGEVVKKFLRLSSVGQESSEDFMYNLALVNKKAKKMVVVEHSHFESFNNFGISIKKIKDPKEHWVACLITSHILANGANIYILFERATLLLEVAKGVTYS